VDNRVKHGDCRRGYRHYIYNIWISIKDRCFNPKKKQFKDYGGRGITMYSEWINNYPKFKEYILTNLGERPEGMTLDRINNDGNYEPNNLRWATQLQQCEDHRKLNELQISIIKHLLKDGLPQRYLGKLFNVSQTTVRRVML